VALGLVAVKTTDKNCCLRLQVQVWSSTAFETGWRVAAREIVNGNVPDTTLQHVCVTGYLLRDLNHNVPHA
jgi:hypothetical protein